MQAFAYTPGGPESLEAFNQRVADFCLAEDACVIVIRPQLAGSSIVLSLTQMEDIGIGLPVAQMPVVFPLALIDFAALEAKIDECVQAIERQDSDTDVRMPMGVTVLFDDKSGTGYLVVDVNIGELDTNSEQQ